ncbi:MAG: glycine betaine ABC transporter substrate-binding protein [Clostridium sp.]|uniref:ABC transporter permease/substrate-binding protein n=1 Tax=Clostridium sp. TaxID=1506 RepID=UPI002FC9C2F2
MNLINSFISNIDQIGSLFIQHIGLTLIAVVIAVIVGVPIGILITKNEKLSKSVIMVANTVQAVPSLALLGFLIPLLGIGSVPAIVMVVLYSLLPIIKNTYTGIMSISPDIIECAKGIGLTNNQILRMIKIPLAMPIIMAGIRIAAVTAVGLMTIAAFIGAGGLGYLVFTGIQTVDNNLILQGAIPAALLALAIDFLVARIEKWVTPSGIKDSKGIISRKKKMGKNTKRGICIVLVVALIGSGFVYFNKSNKEVISIGSKNFTEQLILGNMYADLVEAHTDLRVDRKLNLGGTDIAFKALNSGEIDMYVDYTGTYFINVMDQDMIKDPEKLYDIVKKSAKEKHNIEILDPIGFNNTYGIAVKRGFAEKNNLKTITDLKKYSKDLIISPTMEFTNRDDGLKGIEETYNLRFNKVLPVDGGLRYKALESNECQVIDAFTTDGLLRAFDLVVLEDDKFFFPDYSAVPFVNGESAKRYPEIIEVFNKLSGMIDEKTMIELNYKVDKLSEKPKDVARQFLEEKGLI